MKYKQWLVGFCLLASVSLKAETVQLAVPFAETGSVAQIGDQVKQGILAAESFLPKGANSLKVAFYDDRCDAKEAVAVANKIIARGDVALVLGHTCSSATQAVIKLYTEEGIMVMSPTSTAIPLASTQHLFARTVASDSSQSEELIATLRHFKGKRIAIVHDNDAYGKGIADSLLANAEVKNMNVVMSDGVIKGEKDFSAFVNKVVQKRVDVLVYLGYYTESSAIIKKLRSVKSETTVLMSEGGCVGDFMNLMKGVSLKEVICMQTPKLSNNPKTKVVLDSLAKQSIFLSEYGIYAFAIYQVYLDAIQRHTKGVDIATEIRSGKTYSTILGDIQFSKEGNILNLGYQPMVFDSKGEMTPLVY